MTPTIFIIGTSHAYQFGEGAVFGETTCSLEKAILFRNFLTRACCQYQIRGIGEELSIIALSEMNRTESIPKLVADSLSLPHRYCDPDRAEREKLGIRDENFVISIGQMSGKSVDEIEKDVCAERRKRERHWLNQLNELSAWPALFVCGTWHVPSFSSLLLQSDVVFAVVAEGWI